MNTEYVIGIDEVGRGPLAGPVAVGIVAIEKDKYKNLWDGDIFPKNKDSKKLTPKKREAYFEKIKELKNDGVLRYGVFFESNAVIDRQGIVGAINLALAKGLESLNLDPDSVEILLDGGLKAPSCYKKQQSIIKGDESQLVIALASIVAKVTRDSNMEELAKDVPYYDLKNNKGYGTAKHIADLRLYGPCPLHRRSFISKLLTIE